MIYKNKKAAMEMTMGTMVTIVLLVAVLVMILFFISQILDVGTNAIDEIDSVLRKEIQETLTSDSNAKIAIVPKSREITLRKGKDDGKGFGFILRNDGEADTFTYEVSAEEISADCNLRLPEADNLISLGKKGSVVMPAGSLTEQDLIIRFKIPDTTPPCQIRYVVDVEKGGQPYVSSVSVDVIIKGA